MQPRTQPLMPTGGITPPALAAVALSPVHMLIVDTDSMSPTLNRGDQVLYDPTVRKVRGEGLYIFRSAFGMNVIRRVTVNPARKLWTVKCDNPAYHGESNLPDDGKGFEIVGRITWMGRQL